MSRPSHVRFKAKKTVAGEQFFFISGTDVKNCKVPSTNTLHCCTPENFENANSDCCVLRIMSKTPAISVGIQMERSVSVSSDRNIRAINRFAGRREFGNERSHSS